MSAQCLCFKSCSLGCLSSVQANRNVNWKQVNLEKLGKVFYNIKVYNGNKALPNHKPQCVICSRLLFSMLYITYFAVKLQFLTYFDSTYKQNLLFYNQVPNLTLTHMKSKNFSISVILFKYTYCKIKCNHSLPMPAGYDYFILQVNK